MTEAVFLLALVAGGIGALAGNRAAAALLASTAFTSGLSASGVPFVMPLWMLVDLCVVIVIAHPRIRAREVAILALYFPLWGTYFLDGMAAWRASVLIASAQLLLTFPLFRAVESGRRLLQFIKRDGGGMAFAASRRSTGA